MQTNSCQIHLACGKPKIYRFTVLIFFRNITSAFPCVCNSSSGVSIQPTVPQKTWCIPISIISSGEATPQPYPGSIANIAVESKGEAVESPCLIADLRKLWVNFPSFHLLFTVSIAAVVVTRHVAYPCDMLVSPRATARALSLHFHPDKLQNTWVLVFKKQYFWTMNYQWLQSG